jgi:serine/threonine-protein kinase
LRQTNFEAFSVAEADLTLRFLYPMLALKENLRVYYFYMKDAAVMVTTDLGACEWFVWDLRRSNLIERGRLDQLVAEFLGKNPMGEPPALAKFLAERDILTAFQADRLLQGKTQGFVLGPYTLIDALGSGSMGTVYKARSKNDSDWYAVKVLPRRSMWNVRLARRKVRAFEQCQHPAVVPFVDVGTSGGMHYLAWPFVEGETLDKLVAREGALSPALAARIVLQAAEGLEACHKQELFHGLLKPSNLMIAEDHKVRILDFGIGSLLAETEGESLVDTMSTANSVASGLDCASPESIMDPTNLNAIGDQYSLGCVLYFCLTGRYPFPDGSAADKMVAQQFKEPTRLRDLAPDVPEPLVEVVERLMQKNPQARYPGHEEVMEALKPLAEGNIAAPRPALRARAAGTVSGAPKLTADVADPTSRSAPLSSVLPTRQSFSGVAAAARSSPIQLAPTPVCSVPETASNGHGSPVKREEAPRPARSRDPDPSSHNVALPSTNLNWEDRLGPIGIAISAIIVCAVAWLLTWKMF